MGVENGMTMDRKPEIKHPEVFETEVTAPKCK